MKTIKLDKPIIPNSASKVNTLDYLKHYLDAGFNLIPLKERDKTPALPEWTPLCDKPLTWTELKDRFEKNPRLNIGIILNHDVIVIDVDHEDEAPKELTRLIDKYPTTTVQTRRGRHYYYHYKGSLSCRKFDWGEFRTGNCYVVAPPSIHPNGSQYRFLDGLGLESMTDLPEEFLQKFSVEKPHKARRDKALYHHTKNPNLVRVLSMKGKTHINKGITDISLAIFLMDKVFDRRVVGLGKKFCCPGHDDTHPSAALCQRENGQIGMKCFASGLFFSLEEWYCMMKNGITEDSGFTGLSATTQFKWRIRLLRDAGLIDIPKIRVPSHEKEATAQEQKVFDGFIDLLSISAWYNTYSKKKTPRGEPYSYSFASQWTGVPEKTVTSCLHQLYGKRYMKKISAKTEVRKAGNWDIYHLSDEDLLECRLSILKRLNQKNGIIKKNPLLMRVFRL